MQANQTGAIAPAYSSASRWAARGLFLATLVALPFTLAACSTQTSQPSAPPPMPTVNTARTSAATEPATEDTQATPVPSTGVASETPLLPEQIEPPVPSDAARENSFDGAEAYAYFLFQAWWYLINTHDVHWWDTNIPDCEWKVQKRGEAVEALNAGVIDLLPPIHPQTIERAVNESNSSEYQIKMRSRFGPLERVLPDGQPEVLEDKGTIEFTAHVLYNSAGWRLVNASIVRMGER